jgi:hypothetical protein
MFGLLDGLKYRSETTVQIHSILILVPKLKDLLRTLTLGRAIRQFRKMKVSPIEAATAISIQVLEKFMYAVPKEFRELAIQQLQERSADNFAWFRDYYGQLIKHKAQEHPKGMPNLTVAIGFAFWFVGKAARDGEISQYHYETFVDEVVGVLRGVPPKERSNRRIGEWSARLRSTATT